MSNPLNNNLSLFMGQFPSVPQIPSVQGAPPLPGTSGVPSVGQTFSKVMMEVSNSVQQPQQLAKDMLSGKKEFNSAELMTSMLEAEQRLNMTVRVLNEIVKGLKQLENIQV